MNPLPATPASWIGRFTSRLRFPQLFMLTAGLLAVDLVIPDFIPFFDEILLALATALFASWKTRRGATSAAEPPPVKDVTPRPPPGS